MMQVIDLKGRSGAAYRFRLVADSGELPAHAGNLAIVRGSGSNLEVLACGTRRSLLELEPAWAELTKDDARVYVRLNVSRTTRLGEHDDLVDALTPSRVMLEAD